MPKYTGLDYRSKDRTPVVADRAAIDKPFEDDNPERNRFLEMVKDRVNFLLGLVDRLRTKEASDLPFTDTDGNKTSVGEALGLAASSAALTAHLADTTNAHAASAISVAATPVNYTAATADVEAHLAGIDAALATAGGGDLLSDLVNSEVSVTTTTALDASAFGKMHACSGTTADYTVTLPAASGNAGKLIGIRGAAGLTKFVTVDASGSELIGAEEFWFIIASRTIVLLCDGAGWSIAAQSDYKLPADMIYSGISSSMTAAQINAVFRQLPKNLNSFSLTVNFGAGTYTTDAPIVIGAFADGTLYVNGDTTIGGLSVAQNRIIDSSGSDINAVEVRECTCRVEVAGFKVIVNTSSAYRFGFLATRCSGAYFQFCYVVGTGTSYGVGLGHVSSSGRVVYCYVSNVAWGVYSNASLSASEINDDTGTPPAYALVASYGARLGKSSTQPSGSLANEYANTYGEIGP